REVSIYGKTTLDEINSELISTGTERGVTVDVYQSNHEGEIVDKINELAPDLSAIIINPAAFTHYSISIRDALAAADVPVIEVHLSNIHCREEFRRDSVVSPVTVGQVTGFGPHSYYLALEAALKLVGAA
ncbi:MAG: type II 3-dehydroquinate dehydratase, partial [Terriglobia bacterium]